MANMSLAGEIQLGDYRGETIEVPATLIVDLLSIFNTHNKREIYKAIDDMPPAQEIAIWRMVWAAAEELEARHNNRFYQPGRPASVESS